MRVLFKLVERTKKLELVELFARENAKTLAR